MKIVSWNVNSIHQRLERLLAWLGRHKPAVMCLQETKVVDQKFPHAALTAAGYQVIWAGQKAYNGVAILSLAPLQRLPLPMPAFDDQPAQARLIAARTLDTVIICAYVPNGHSVGSPKWQYKLAWLAALRQRLQQHFSPSDKLVVVGDTNVAPADHDVANIGRWADTVLCHPQARASWQALLDWGLVDTLRQLHPRAAVYSWWDYRAGGFAKNDGLRIDHILASAPLAAELLAAGIDRDERRGLKPSDHVPVWADFGTR